MNFAFSRTRCRLHNRFISTVDKYVLKIIMLHSQLVVYYEIVDKTGLVI